MQIYDINCICTALVIPDTKENHAHLRKATVLHLIFWVLGFLMNPKLKLGLGKLVYS